MDTFRASNRKTVKILSILLLTLIGVLGLSNNVFAQTPTASPAAPAITGVIGEVKAIDAPANQIIVRTDSGVIVTVNLSDKTQYKRMAPGAKTLDTATIITLADVGQGD